MPLPPNNAVVQCIKCGGPLGCPCWLILQCPECGDSKTVARDWHDHPEADTVVYPCPYHQTPESDIQYFSKGKEVVWEDDASRKALDEHAPELFTRAEVIKLVEQVKSEASAVAVGTILQRAHASGAEKACDEIIRRLKDST